MDLADHLEDLVHFLLHLSSEGLLFCLIKDSDAAFEVTDNFLVCERS